MPLLTNRKPTGAISISRAWRISKATLILGDCSGTLRKLRPVTHLVIFLKEVGDPVTGVPIGNTEKNLKSAIEGETYEYTEMYPGMAKTARQEDFQELAEWFESLAKAEKSHAGRFTKGRDRIAGKEPADAAS